MYQTIGIICAIEKEFALIRESLAGGHPEPMGRFTAYVGQSGDKTIIAAVSGIGKVNAAVCAQILADDFKAEAIINTGIAGSLNNDINIGDIVLSTDVLYHDMDATGFGYPKCQIPQMEEASNPRHLRNQEPAATESC